ncbi:MAG TPA: hypothetical protein VFU55_02870 [Terracidiphilus sp.]|nr:hypothetical protein [Terracidiphilus sp.]
MIPTKFRACEPHEPHESHDSLFVSGVAVCRAMQPAKTAGRRSGVCGAATVEADWIRHSM